MVGEGGVWKVPDEAGQCMEGGSLLHMGIGMALRCFINWR